MPKILSGVTKSSFEKLGSVCFRGNDCSIRYSCRYYCACRYACRLRLVSFHERLKQFRYSTMYSLIAPKSPLRQLSDLLSKVYERPALECILKIKLQWYLEQLPSRGGPILTPEKRFGSLTSTRSS
ncbi:hypothetical protein BpHYR1_015384 [Brachionus plicatilis]|uniref:Uncharacterized protein n=1 Tax=Brachionus plicatilis TaxID=10195 RepID=A0A3M7PFS7_BRAPC|nr:hypothetical protein BpHYR1_015384 [Brachionus plicatilis]